MENLKENLTNYIKSKNAMDCKIWDIFYRYIETFKINFNGPASWEYKDDGVMFYNEDYRNPINLHIPLNFFENPEIEFAINEIQTFSYNKTLNLKVEMDCLKYDSSLNIPIFMAMIDHQVETKKLLHLFSTSNFIPEHYFTFNKWCKCVRLFIDDEIVCQYTSKDFIETKE